MKLRPTEARVVLIDVDGPVHRFDLTFRTVLAVDQVMAALADIRAALVAPADVGGLRTKVAKELIESNQRRMRALGKEGRQFGVLVLFATQKGTADAVPTAIRDNLEVGVCFAVSTLEAGEAALGPGIRADKVNDPTALRDKARYVGVCVVTGVPGLDGKYAKVRVGTIEDHDLAAQLDGTAAYRRDLAELHGTTAADRPELVAVGEDPEAVA